MQKLPEPAPDESKPASMAERIGSSPVPKPVPTSAFTTAFGCPREFLNNRFLYLVISPRARGLSIGVNMNPDKHCNFDCVYCEVDREQPASEPRLDLRVMAAELEWTLALVHSGRIRKHPRYSRVPAELLRLHHVCLSGDGEPTLCPKFPDIVEEVIRLRARALFPFFKIVLVTNASGLDRPEVEAGLHRLTPCDEVWAKLDAGTQDYMQRVNKPDCCIESVLAKILGLARQRPVIIQSLFPAIRGQAPPAHEIETYVQRLKELKDAGAKIPLVQICSATRPPTHLECGHLPLRTLSAIAKRVQRVTRLTVEVF